VHEPTGAAYYLTTNQPNKIKIFKRVIGDLISSEEINIDIVTTTISQI
jgi:hypothetical protein